MTAPAADPNAVPATAGISAWLGPTNTGKTYRAIEQMLSYRSGLIGLPLRLLAREVYDKVSSRVGETRVALVTGEEKRIPPRPDYWVCTVESMPTQLDVEFVAVDEIQLAEHPQRGHTFTDKMLHARGQRETWFMGSASMQPLIEQILPTARIQRHPRFSTLRYTGTQGLGGLPPRTAVVAFSVSDVYELAERMRQHHGGTAVVLGALSPRTRNAQVAMYQAGEVQYMVATDAIGMGLNMDVDRIVFASLDKYDGQAPRPLRNDELAQIAGRAGRYQKDGGFGTLRPLEGLSPQTVYAIENHRFSPIKRVVWRNSDLDFTSIDSLIASLRQRPKMRCLELIDQADDHDALVALSHRHDIRARARREGGVKLLWDVCRIPDFRKLLLDTHVQLLGSIFMQVSGPSGRIDEDWMAKRIERLASRDGDIETLMSRIAFIRTWTYITHCENFVSQATHWQEVTRDIEDRLSDALHERLTEKFVARTSAASIRTQRRAMAQARDEGRPFEALRELALAYDEAAEAEADFVERAIEASHEELVLDERGNITWGGHVLGRLRAGPGLLHPDVVVTARDSGPEGRGASLSHTAPRLSLPPGTQSRLLRRLRAWVKDAIAALLGPAGRLDPATLGPAARGILYQLEQSLGTLDVRSTRGQIGAMTPEDRRALEAAGVVFGRTVAFVRSSLRPEAIRLRAKLWCLHRGGDLGPSGHDLSLPVHDSIDPSFYVGLGYVACGPRAIRADHLHATQRQLDALAAGQESFELPSVTAESLGDEREVPAILSGMGYRRVASEGDGGGYRYARVPSKRRRRSRSRGKSRS